GTPAGPDPGPPEGGRAAGVGRVRRRSGQPLGAVPALLPFLGAPRRGLRIRQHDPPRDGPQQPLRRHLLGPEPALTEGGARHRPYIQLRPRGRGTRSRLASGWTPPSGRGPRRRPPGPPSKPYRGPPSPHGARSPRPP